MDLQYLLDLNEETVQHLKFNDKDQTIEISPDLPQDHPLQKFRNGNVLDVDKYFEKVL